jgi:hypothetical protein
VGQPAVGSRHPRRRPARRGRDRRADGTNILHVDLVNPVVDRWAVLEMGAARSSGSSRSTSAPPRPDDHPSRATRPQEYDLDRAIAQAQATPDGEPDEEWMDAATTSTGRCCGRRGAKEAFGKAILKTGWDKDEGIPTLRAVREPEPGLLRLVEAVRPPALAWAIVPTSSTSFEARAASAIDLPTDATGALTSRAGPGCSTSATWTSGRAEQATSTSEYWVRRGVLGAPPGQPDPL